MADTISDVQSICSKFLSSYRRDPRFRPLDALSEFDQVCRTSLGILWGIFGTCRSEDISENIRETALLLPGAFAVYFKAGLHLAETSQDQSRLQWWIQNFPGIMASCENSTEFDQAITFFNNATGNNSLNELIEILAESHQPVTFHRMVTIARVLSHTNNLGLVKDLQGRGFLEVDSVRESLFYLMEKLPGILDGDVTSALGVNRIFKSRTQSGRNWLRGDRVKK
ncbi:MAG: hypothetical protein NZO16_07275 [Deltaproteobacteria bacterium]|nr:hypothetical protein [Deltaproteobacteria bacterium]